MNFESKKIEVVVWNGFKWGILFIQLIYSNLSRRVLMFYTSQYKYAQRI